MPGLLGAPCLVKFTCLLAEPGLPWSKLLFLNPPLLGIPGLFGIPGLLGMPGLLGALGLLEEVCLIDMFCLLFCLFGFIFGSSLLMGAPTSSGVLTILLGFFVLGSLIFWPGLFDNCLLLFELYMVLGDSFDLKLLFMFLGFAISWIGGFAGLFTGGVMLFWKFFLSLLKFCEVLLFIFLLMGFAWDCDLLKVLFLLGFLDWFEIVFRLSGLLSGFFNNGFLFEFSLVGFPFKEEIIGDLTSLFCL